MEIEIEGDWKRIGLVAGGLLAALLMLLGLYTLGRHVSICVAGRPLVLTPARYRSVRYNGFLVKEYNALVTVDGELADALDESRPFEERVEAVDAADASLARVRRALEKAQAPTAVLSERAKALAQCGGMYEKAANELVRAMVWGKEGNVAPDIEEARDCLRGWR